VNAGNKFHDGNAVNGFAPGIAESELPVELTVILDSNAGTVSITRDGALLGGTFLYDGLGGKDLLLAVGTYHPSCRVTIISYTGPPPSPLVSVSVSTLESVLATATVPPVATPARRLRHVAPHRAALAFDISKVGKNTEGRITAANPAVMEGSLSWHPCLSVQGGSTGVHKYVVLLERSNSAILGVAEADCDVNKMIHQQVLLPTTSMLC
jgi:hypothetical protein